MAQIPTISGLDNTLALRRDPYRFIARRCRCYGTDLFQTRILLRKTICMVGPEAAELFYRPDSFLRHGSMPPRIQKTLSGGGGVQSLDDAAHAHRKQMFMALMSPDRLDELSRLTDEAWRHAIRRWRSNGSHIVLYDEARELLTRVVCAWSGVPLPQAEVKRRAEDLTALFDYAGDLGPKWRARLARTAANAWIAGVIRDIRVGRLHPPAQSAARQIAAHRDLAGRLLPIHAAAVELLNILRPTVAVAVYIAFVAHALHEHPEYRRRLRTEWEHYAELFVQEVRRFYPFFPAVTARVRRDFAWRGYDFPAGRQVMLDLYGTDHDPRCWEEPERFFPERFRHRHHSALSFIPQGGGDPQQAHRCAGEWITINLMKRATHFLARQMSYELPLQDLGIDLTRLPALPRSKVLLTRIGNGA